MIPTIDTRIDSLIRVMTHLIIPELKDPLALDQAKLVVGHLMCLRGQVDHSVHYERLEYYAARRLAAKLVVIAAGGPATREAADILIANLRVERQGAAEIRQDLDALNQGIDTLMRAVNEDGERSFLADGRELVIMHSKAVALRSRAWFAALGFENASDLPSIADMMRDFEALSGTREQGTTHD